MKKIAVAAFAAAALGLATTNASAITISPTGTVTFGATDVGALWGLDFGICADPGLPCPGGVPNNFAGVGATAAFRIDSYAFNAGTNLTSVGFTVGLRNDTIAPNSSRISVLGFATNPNIFLIGSDATGSFDDVNTGSFPQPFPVIEACVLDEQNDTCNNGVGGPTNGQVIFFSLVLAFPGNLASIQMSDFGVRYQSLNIPSLGITGGSGVGIGTPLPPDADPVRRDCRARADVDGAPGSWATRRGPRSSSQVARPQHPFV